MFAVVGILALLIALLLPASRGSREAARRMQCSNHLKQIALALQNYADTYGCLPPAHTVDAEGKPLHSWRTLILPFMEQKELYDQIDLSKPWDDPANEKAMKTKISYYVCPSETVRSSVGVRCRNFATERHTTARLRRRFTFIMNITGAAWVAHC